MEKLHILDLSIVGIYLLLCLVIGLYKSTKIKTIREYTVGSGNFPLIALVATNFATYISARSTMGDVAEIFQSGLIYGIPVLLCFLSWLITSRLYISNIYQFKNCISLSEIMYKLYGKLALHITNFCSIILSIGFITTQMLAIGYLFQEYFQIQYHIGVMIGFSILTFYSAFGGIRGVVLTDIFQFFIFFCILPIVCGFLYYEVGGYYKIKASLPKSHFDSFLIKDTIILFIGYIFYTIIPLHSAPYIQRLLMSNNQEKLKKTYNICAFLTLIFSILILLIGLMMRIKTPEIEPNLVFYHFINNYLPPILKSMMLVGILAIIMSTADSWLNNASAIIAHDIAKKINSKITNKQQIKIAIIFTFLISLLCVICAFLVDSILKAIFMVFNFWVPIILVPLTAGFLKFRTNSTSFLYSVIMAILLCLLGRYISSDFGVVSMTTGTIGSAIGLFCSHYFKKKI
ncbi:sodium:solute symporter [Rickettsiales endosymbiont of Trichoplax sp. H2]|uniref:sodium:solute symporter family protein n=1 Tax=Rickettsiales endosymbiont of Trichoplax sp. H2 TaxID=2021221 RepID=UPI0012B3ECFF|nr:sodium:solute symporter family protein [Rickettsiales endosymbiont of Trichoplax sp. H2]MSO14137.1 Low affinity sodium-glucose cotransporter [Rickettsiales endosymbiont of Trichoplax sp. H2]